MVLCVGHIMVNLSLAFIPVSDKTLKEEQHHFLKWFCISLGSCLLTVVFGAYVVVLPIFKCLKINKVLAHLVIVFVSILYFNALSVMLWALQHILVQATIMQCYGVSGQIGLVFGLLVLYDNMRGESTKDLYERVLNELDDELELGEMCSNKIGIDDSDVHRLN